MANGQWSRRGNWPGLGQSDGLGQSHGLNERSGIGQSHGLNDTQQFEICRRGSGPTLLKSSRWSGLLVADHWPLTIDHFRSSSDAWQHWAAEIVPPVDLGSWRSPTTGH
jgi:hypothetical protein